MVSFFRVANFNVENLNEPGVRFAGREGNSGDPYEPGLYESKIAWIGGLLQTARPDLIGFQELFSKNALADAVARAGYLNEATVFAPDLESNITGDPPEATGPFCGVVSRFPMLASESILDFPPEVKDRIKVQYNGEDVVDLPISQFQRPVLRVEVNLRPDAEPVSAVVFVAHLKSKRPQILDGEDAKDPVVQALGQARSLILRGAEAAALRALVVAATQNTTTPVFVLGDLNDDLAAVTTQTVAGDEPYRFAPFDQKLAAWDRLLYSVHSIQEQLSYRAVSYSHIYGGRYELLDHIFVSQEFFARNSKRLGEVRNTRTYNDHLTDERLTAEVQRGLSPVSDHGMVVSEIVWAS